MRKDMINLKDELEEVIDMINKSEIARRFGCSWNTVKKYLSEESKSTNSREYSSKLDKYKGIIIDKTDNYSASGRSIYNFIKDKGYDGSYGLVSKYIKEYKNEEQSKAIIRFETTPGLQAQVDWKENFKILNRDNQQFEINIFLIVLRFF